MIRQKQLKRRVIHQLDISIQAIFFDIGGTLVNKRNNGDRDLAIIAEMVRLLGADCTPEELVKKIRVGEQEYKAWQARTLQELKPEDKWSRFYLPNDPEDLIRQQAAQLQAWWSQSRGERWITPETAHTLHTLSSRGYTLGAISHTSPKYIQEAGLSSLFQATLHAAEFGRRKPHPSIFLEAARICGVAPEACAYVGDRPSRDVVGAREAGYGKVILLQNGGLAAETVPCPMQADATIQSISELLTLFPAQRKPVEIQHEPESPAVLYDAALSTMWWNKEPYGADTFFRTGRRLGFARFELNHQIPPEVLDSMDLKHFHIATLHDPCPAVVMAKQLEREDRVITSRDETLRRDGVDGVKRTIDQAVRLGARSVVIHPGRITGDHSLDNQLRDLYRKGARATAEYERLRHATAADRLSRRQPHLDSLMKSLHEIISFAKDSGVSLGFENRFHYYELPIFDEMQAILAEFEQPWVGWQLDVGHLQVLAILGFESFTDWLEQFGRRIIGVHLHDVQGIQDHRAPGSGDVDFRAIAAVIPAHALRTVEVDKSLTVEQISAGLTVLAETGCIACI
jgi:HAD superfamily hydrolase (TIGR01549 family)